MGAVEELPKYQWYLVQLRPNCAMIARRNLLRQGFKTFLPLEIYSRGAGSKYVEKLRPFFPGYLFVGIANTPGAAHSIRSTYGISQLVCVGSRPAVVPDQLIEELRSRCNGDDIMSHPEEFKVGEKVRLTRGPFARLVGEVEQIAPDRRAWLLLDFMGHKAKMSAPQSFLQATA